MVTSSTSVACCQRLVPVLVSLRHYNSSLPMMHLKVEEDGVGASVRKSHMHMSSKAQLGVVALSVESGRVWLAMSRVD